MIIDYWSSNCYTYPIHIFHIRRKIQDYIQWKATKNAMAEEIMVKKRHEIADIERTERTERTGMPAEKNTLRSAGQEAPPEAPKSI